VKTTELRGACDSQKVTENRRVLVTLKPVFFAIALSLVATEGRASWLSDIELTEYRAGSAWGRGLCLG
jgi:hypothetical protein